MEMGVRSGGVGWEAEGKLHHSSVQRQKCCVFNKAQKQPECSYTSGSLAAIWHPMQPY